jgi:hypothetical protein
MTENMEEFIQEVSINQVLIAILEEHGPMTVPTLKFLDAKKLNKELVMDYDDEGPSFTFSLRDKNE